MNKRLKSIAADISITVLILVSAFSVSILLQDVLEIDEHISTLFAFAVFLISLTTNGYWYGAISTVISVIAINYAFTDPYFYVDFSVPESIFFQKQRLIIDFLRFM